MEERSKEFWKHVREHVKYPATKKELVEACSNMSDVSEREKKWFADALPNRSYKNAEDMKRTLEAMEAKSPQPK